MPSSKASQDDNSHLTQPFISVQKRSGAKKVSSCDPCKLRRVKCDRANETVRCEQCSERGIRCLTTGDRRKKTVKDKSTNLSETKSGSSVGPGSESVASAEIQSDAVAPSKQFNMPIDLSGESAESKLALSEFVSQFSGHLIDVYFMINKHPVAAYVWGDFKKQFEDAGRKPNQMTPMSEVVAATLIAYGARASSAPAIVGARAPTLPNIDGGDQDLVYYGRRRNAICAVLMKRAVQLADARGVFRVRSRDSIVVLLLLEVLLDHGDSMYKEGQPYRAALHGHVQSLQEDGLQHQISKLQETALGWVLLLRDTMQAACSGRKPRLSDDFLAFVSEKRAELTLERSMQYPFFLHSQMVSFNNLWTDIINLMRSFATRLAVSPRYDRTSQLLADMEHKDEVIWDLYRGLDGLKTRLYFLQELHAPSDFSWPKQPARLLFIQGCHTMRIECIMATFVAHRAIRRELDALSGFREWIDNNEEERRVRLLAVQVESNKRMGEAAREFARLLWSMQNSLEARAGLGIMPGIHALPNECFPEYAKILCNLPTSDEGAAVDYSLETKIEEVGMLLNSVRLLGWAWPDVGDTVVNVARHYEALKELQLSLLARDINNFSATPLFDTDRSLNPSATLGNSLSPQPETSGSHDYMDGSVAPSYAGFPKSPLSSTSQSAGFSWANVDGQSPYIPHTNFDDISFHPPVLDESYALLPDWPASLYPQLQPRYYAQAGS